MDRRYSCSNQSNWLVESHGRVAQGKYCVIVYLIPLISDLCLSSLYPGDFSAFGLSWTESILQKI